MTRAVALDPGPGNTTAGVQEAPALPSRRLRRIVRPVVLFVTNLFNEDIELSRGVVCSICTNTLITPGRPRTIGVRLGTKF